MQILGGRSVFKFDMCITEIDILHHKMHYHHQQQCKIVLQFI